MFEYLQKGSSLLNPETEETCFSQVGVLRLVDIALQKGASFG